MPGPNEPIPSCRAALFVMPPDRSGAIPLGLVEDFMAQKRYNAENFPALGSPVPVDNALNNEEGSLRWGKVLQLDPVMQRTVTPLIQKWTQFDAFNLLVIDPDTQDPIAYCVGVLPQSVDMNFRAGAAAREGYSGLCRYVLRGAEIREAAAA